MSSKSDSKPTGPPSPIGEISQEPSALENFLDANQKKLVIAGILAIVILVGYVVVDGLKEMTRRDNAATVAAARTVPDYEKVSAELAGETAGGSALFLKSQLQWNDQQQQEAIETLEEFISSYPDHPAIGSAYAHLGSYQQQLNNLTEAKEAYNKAVETQSAASSLALLALGDLARGSGENEAARAFYDRIITEYEDSHFQVKGFARERIELIGVESPTEKAPEPPKPNPSIKPGEFSPPTGLPNLNPKPMPTLIPTEGQAPKPPVGDGPAEGGTTGDNSPTEGSTGDLPAPAEGSPAGGTSDEGSEPSPAPANVPEIEDETDTPDPATQPDPTPAPAPSGSGESTPAE